MRLQADEAEVPVEIDDGGVAHVGIKEWRHVAAAHALHGLLDDSTVDPLPNVPPLPPGEGVRGRGTIK